MEEMELRKLVNERGSWKTKTFGKTILRRSDRIVGYRYEPDGTTPIIFQESKDGCVYSRTLFGDVIFWDRDVIGVGF